MGVSIIIDDVQNEGGVPVVCGAPHQGSKPHPLTSDLCECSLRQVGLDEKRRREEELASFQRMHQQATSSSQQRSVDIVTAFQSKVCAHMTVM